MLWSIPANRTSDLDSDTNCYDQTLTTGSKAITNS